MLELLSTVLRRSPEFRATWLPEPVDVIAADARFGMLMHAVATSADGRPLYDQPVWLERTGAIGLPVDQDGHIALLRNFRGALCLPERRGEFPLSGFEGCGQLSLELPRGFPEKAETPAEAARREVEEETGFATTGEVSPLGYTNANTTYFPFSVPTFLVRIDSRRRLKSPGVDNERIDEILLWAEDRVLQAIVDDSIYCGMTRSALMGYFARRQLGTLPSSI